MIRARKFTCSAEMMIMIVQCVILYPQNRCTCRYNFYDLFIPESDSGRSKTLHKLRSKTIALFSKDGGYSTLPK